MSGWALGVPPRVTPHLGHRSAAYRPRLRLVHLGQLSAASPAGQASRVTPVTIALIEGHNASYGSRLSLRVRAPRNRVARMGSRLGVLPRFLRTVVRVWAFVLLVALRNLSGVDVGLDVLPRSSAPPTGLGFRRGAPVRRTPEPRPRTPGLLCTEVRDARLEDPLPRTTPPPTVERCRFGPVDQFRLLLPGTPPPSRQLFEPALTSHRRSI